MTAEPEKKKPSELRHWFRISCRTLHLITTSVLVGGHFFGAPADTLRPWLYGVIASGGALLSTDVLGTPGYLRELRGFAILVKLALVASVALFWEQRVAILFCVIVLSGVVSHMAGRFRYIMIIGQRREPKR